LASADGYFPARDIEGRCERTRHLSPALAQAIVAGFFCTDHRFLLNFPDGFIGEPVPLVRRCRLRMNILLVAIAFALIAAGLIGAIVPVLPGIPLIFAGIWLIAGVDEYRHLGLWWLLGIAAVGAVGLILDLLAGALGAKRVGASPQAVSGALIGTLVGIFFGLPGLLFGPFFGALLGELSSGKSVLRSTQVGAAAWMGLIFGALVKLVSSLIMVALFGAGWWWNRNG
jgi:uncharacterized protein